MKAAIYEDDDNVILITAENKTEEMALRYWQDNFGKLNPNIAIEIKSRYLTNEITTPAQSG